MRRFWETPLMALVLVMVAWPIEAAEARRLFHNAYEVKSTPKTRIYVYAPGASEERLYALRERLVSRGAEKVNIFLPDVVVFDMPSTESAGDMLGDANLQYTTERDVSFRMGGDASDRLAEIKYCYATATMIAQDGVPGLPDDFKDVVHEVPPEIQRASKLPHDAPDGASALPVERGIAQGAEFLIGDIAVITVFPESNGGQENWTNNELSTATQGVTAGMLSFQQRFDYVPINFTFIFHERVPTSYEPIHHTIDDDHLWINDTMGSLNVQQGKDVLLTVHNFNKRAWANHDWVYTGFVANSRKEPSHRFRGAPYTAYANLGGPFLVIPFPAGINDPNQLGELLLFSQIYMHETVHIFWGLDEYPESFSQCPSHSGYLDVYNTNNVEVDQLGGLRGCTPVIQPCIMWNARGREDQPVCSYTEGMMGVIDANNNSIPDVFDMPPTVEFENSVVETVETSGVTVNMRAISQPVLNRNPQQREEDGRVDYAAPLRDATLSLNGVGANRLLPLDGKWDEPEEDLSVRLELNPGLTRVQITPRNAFGADATITKKIYFIGVRYELFSVDVRERGIFLSWNTVGTTFGADFELVRREMTPNGVEEKIFEPVPGDPVGSFKPYTYFDTDVTRGHSYQYLVRGSFEVRGQPRESLSGALEVRAMFPIADGEHLSVASPNPFRETTQITLDVPATVVSSGVGDQPSSTSTSQTVRTPVTITVYDVQGRLVTTLYTGELFAQRETFSWDGTNVRGERVPSGVYFIRAVAGSATDVKKVVVVR